MKYPNNIKKNTTCNNTNHSNRGMSLEYDLNITNEYYKNEDIAIIYKKPTPIKVVKVEYLNKNAVIKEAFFEKPSTTDYNGIYKGKYIDFEAKEVKDKSSFALTNIHKHQLEHIFSVNKHNGISFIIVRFVKCDETYILMSNVLKTMINENKKSISISEFREFGYLIENKYAPRLDYIAVLNKCILED